MLNLSLSFSFSFFLSSRHLSCRTHGYRIFTDAGCGHYRRFAAPIPYIYTQHRRCGKKRRMRRNRLTILVAVITHDTYPSAHNAICSTLFDNHGGFCNVIYQLMRLELLIRDCFIVPVLLLYGSLRFEY